jgi:hypothetical protein
MVGDPGRRRHLLIKDRASFGFWEKKPQNSAKPEVRNAVSTPETLLPLADVQA